MKQWIAQDRYSNAVYVSKPVLTIYLTQERWHHLLESRPELEPFSHIAAATEFGDRLLGY